MLGWSVKRRLGYLALAMGGVLVLALVLYLVFKPAPTCSDGRQNQDEIGIDCGGSCSRACAVEIRPIKEIWTKVFKVDEGKYDVASFIINPNREYGTRRFRYAVRIFDKDNLLITTREGQTYVNPGEQFFVFLPRLAVGRRTPIRAVFDVIESPLWQKLAVENPKLVVSNQQFNPAPQPRLAARLTNQALSPVTDIEVVVVLSNLEQNALAVSSTLVDRLNAGESKEIVFTWPRPPSAPPVLIDFYSRVDLGGPAR